MPYPRIELHVLHPPPFADSSKRQSLPDYHSGATGIPGRSSEGFCLRRLQPGVSNGSVWAYALQDALVDLKSSGMRIVLVGLPVAQRDILEAIHVIPELVSTKDLFPNFAELKAVLPKVLEDIGATKQGLMSRP